MTQTKNKVLAMFNLNEVKKAIANCPNNEIVILCGHWSINQPKYSINEDPESIEWDLQEFEDIIGHPVMVSDYDDLIVDVYGINNY